jgi:DNA polymerase-1
MIALIDQDLLCYRCAASAENDDLGIAIYRIDELLDNILNKTEATSYRAFLTSSSNFRKQIYPEYKANRTQPKPKHLRDLQVYSLEKLNAEYAPDGLEADDALAINQKYLGVNIEDTIICSLDKDLLQVPGHHFSWEINGKGWSRPDTFIEQSELEGLRLFYKQCLKGDTSDNVKGIEGLGEKKAAKILADCTSQQEMFNIVRDLYGNDEEFIMNASVLWILRSLDDNWKDRFDALIQE